MRRLILVRHGESMGNVARERAEAAGAEVIDIDLRDPDVPLSELGLRQSQALGCWLAELDPAERPVQAWSSPYRRAVQTAAEALTTAGLPLPIRRDERLRDRELGILDLLTSMGVRNRFPEEATRRRWLGKLYYRPPGGESWADVALRIRSFLAELGRGDAGPVLIVCHDAVILLFRYVLENLDEAALFDLARAGSIRNASVTTLQQDEDGQWHAIGHNDDDYLQRFGVGSVEHPGEREGLHG
ncbi:MAG TPA: histidine phosphatase family protein [Jatrophihabitans sp.]|nr:histidine phosphatase family protein [Jatrophihabitans sp.]